MNSANLPSEEDLHEALSSTASLWREITGFVLMKYPKAIQEWKYAGKNFSWSYRLKDKKRVIIYLLPGDGYFRAAFVFGQKATDKIMNSTILEKIKEELRNARVYAEGRGIRIDVKDITIINNIKKLIEIKISS
jgi:hypothetical protein